MSVKKSLSYMTLGFVLAGMISSCKKDHTPITETQTINETIANNSDYTFDLGSFGDEEGASISRQALHYQESSLNRENTGSVTYHYQPLSDYIGTDEVQLKSEKGSNGESANNKILLTTIKFMIVTR